MNKELILFLLYNNIGKWRILNFYVTNVVNWKFFGLWINEIAFLNVFLIIFDSFGFVTHLPPKVLVGWLTPWRWQFSSFFLSICVIILIINTLQCGKKVLLYCCKLFSIAQNRAHKLLIKIKSMKSKLPVKWPEKEIKTLAIQKNGSFLKILNCTPNFH